ncbi:MAG TPA: DNA alkylation response protein, partial [Sphingomonas sp.]
MTTLDPIADLDTHEVTNQPPPFEDIDLFATDHALADAVGKAGGAMHRDRLTKIGRRAGSAEVIGWGVEANRYPPELDTHDRWGRRIDEVRFHPAYH